MNVEKISRVITLTAELITRAEHVETEAGGSSSSPAPRPPAPLKIPQRYASLSSLWRSNYGFERRSALPEARSTGTETCS
jgi:hypothetical protein